MAEPVSFLESMELRYDSRSGALFVCDFEDGCALIARGYSGKGIYKNDPAFADRIAEGPIPRGLWKLESPVTHPRLGPHSIRLTPEKPETARGRSGFFIHGDNATGTASSGCIIIPRNVRVWIGKQLIRRLEVV